MRTALFLFILGGLPVAAQTETNMACVERLEIPKYPVLAKQARVTGVLTETVLIGPTGAASKASPAWNSKIERGERLFLASVEEAMRASSFTKACAGKEVKLVFNFVIEGEAVSGHADSKFSFGYPNQFWIATPPQLAMP